MANGEAAIQGGPHHQNYSSHLRSGGLCGAPLLRRERLFWRLRGELEELLGQRHADPSRPRATPPPSRSPSLRSVTPPPTLVGRMVQVPLRTLPLAVGSRAGEDERHRRLVFDEAGHAVDVAVVIGGPVADPSNLVEEHVDGLAEDLNVDRAVGDGLLVMVSMSRGHIPLTVPA